MAHRALKITQGGRTLTLDLDQNGESRLKQRLLDSAEIIDAWRVFPRIFLAFFLFVLWDVHTWYQGRAEYPDIYVNVVWGAVGVITGFYVQSGRKWGK